jgi:cyanophycin synthetase
LLAQGLRAAGVAADRFEVIEDEQDAIQAGLELGERGDLLVIFGDDITRCWKQIIYFSGHPYGPLGLQGEDTRSDGIGKLAGESHSTSPIELPRAQVIGRERREADEVEPVRDEPARASEKAPRTSGGSNVIVDDRGVRLAREEAD